MSSAPPPTSLVLFDTGPLLAFAVDNPTSGLLEQRYSGRSAIVTDVDEDLAGLQRNHSPGVAEAAKRALRSYQWLRRDTVDDPVVLRRAETLREQLRAFKRHPDTDHAGSRTDWAESVTVAHAETLRAPGTEVLVVSNDDAARALAASVGFRVATSVDVLRTMIAAGMLTRRQGWQLLEKLRRAGIDSGDVVPTAQDL